MEVSPLRALTRLTELTYPSVECSSRNGNKPVEGIDTASRFFRSRRIACRNGNKPVEGIDTILCHISILLSFCRNRSKPVEGIDTLRQFRLLHSSTHIWGQTLWSTYKMIKRKRWIITRSRLPGNLKYSGSHVLQVLLFRYLQNVGVWPYEVQLKRIK